MVSPIINEIVLVRMKKHLPDGYHVDILGYQKLGFVDICDYHKLYSIVGDIHKAIVKYIRPDEPYFGLCIYNDE